MTFRDKILHYLKKEGKKPYHLADEAGIARAVIYRYLKKERGLLLSSVEKIESVIGQH